MKVGRKQSGFTIVETMIVLAVSGGLFLVAALAVSGKQARQEFTQSIQDVRSQIQQVVNEVATGYYPNMNNLSCTVGANGPVFSGIAAGQGENAGCISLGKAIQFDVAGTNPEQMRVYTVAGLQKQSNGNDVEDLDDAKPKVVAPSTTAPGNPDITDRKLLLYGLSTLRMTDLNTGANIGSFGVLSTLAKYGTAGMDSSSQQLKAYPIANTSLNATALAGAESINNNLITSSPAVDKGVAICFVSGGTDQSGLITIGGGNRQLSVTLQIKSNKDCS
ncbi:MAG TPA: type II secretion system protein [Candidatus Saccharimonadales bacterium]|nr:type II secretion system protein [Candidatus Saccharimonadales bacterium]